MTQAGGQILGTVLTKYRMKSGSYGYGYGYGYGHGDGRDNGGMGGVSSVVALARRLISNS